MHDFRYAKLSEDVGSFLAKVSQARKRARLSNRLRSALRAAFNQDGLSGVDTLIENINGTLVERGSPVGFGSGCAAEGPPGERPDTLHVYFLNFATERVLARATVALG